MSSKDSSQRPATASSLRELPLSVAPPRDLWPQIEASLAKERAGAAGTNRFGSLRPSRGQWLSLAAAVGSLAVGVWLGRSMMPTTAPAAAGPATVVTGDPAVLKAAFVSDPRYLQQRATMIRSVEAQLKQMSPETQAKVGASLATIRKSMQEIQSALGRDPGNALLQELLVNTYQDEMRVLTAVHEASDAGEEI
jgi:hypothetical protein